MKTFPKLVRPAAALLTAALVILFVITTALAQPGLLSAVGGMPQADRPTTAGAIEGGVYFDANGNGVRDAQDNGIAGVLIEIRDQATGGQTYYASATTTPDGIFRFADLPNNTFLVTENDLSLIHI